MRNSNLKVMRFWGRVGQLNGENQLYYFSCVNHRGWQSQSLYSIKSLWISNTFKFFISHFFVLEPSFLEKPRQELNTFYSTNDQPLTFLCMVCSGIFFYGPPWSEFWFCGQVFKCHSSGFWDDVVSKGGKSGLWNTLGIPGLLGFYFVTWYYPAILPTTFVRCTKFPAPGFKFNIPVSSFLLVLHPGPPSYELLFLSQYL